MMAFNFDDPRTQGLLTLAAGLLSQSGWQPKRVGVGEALGNAGIPAMQAMQQARSHQLQIEDMMQMRKLRNLEMQKILAGLQSGVDYTNQANLVDVNQPQLGGGLVSPGQIQAPSQPQSQLGVIQPDSSQQLPNNDFTNRADALELKAANLESQLYKRDPKTGRRLITNEKLTDDMRKDIQGWRSEADRLRTHAEAKASSLSPLGKLQVEHSMLVRSLGPDHEVVKQYEDRIQKEISRNDTQYERALAGLKELYLAKQEGKKLSGKDYANAIGHASAIESTSRAVQDPNTGQITFISNVVPDLFSVKSLFGNAPPVHTGQFGATSRIGNQRVTVIPGPGARPGEAEVKVLSEGDALRGILADTKKLFNPDWVGPVAGRYGEIRQKYIGQNEPGRAEFIAKSNQYKNRLIKFITGAQMSEVETTRLINEIPDPNDPPSTYQAKLKTSNDNIDYVMRAYQQNMQQGNIRPIGGNPVSPNQEPTVRPLNPNPGIGKPQYQTIPQTPSGAGGGTIHTWEDDTYIYRQLPDGSVQRKKK